MLDGVSGDGQYSYKDITDPGRHLTSALLHHTQKLPASLLNNSLLSPTGPPLRSQPIIPLLSNGVTDN